jgi:hypothetical protein
MHQADGDLRNRVSVEKTKKESLNLLGWWLIQWRWLFVLTLANEKEEQL